MSTEDAPSLDHRRSVMCSRQPRKTPIEENTRPRPSCKLSGRRSHPAASAINKALALSLHFCSSQRLGATSMQPTGHYKQVEPHLAGSLAPGTRAMGGAKRRVEGVGWGGWGLPDRRHCLHDQITCHGNAIFHVGIAVGRWKNKNGWPSIRPERSCAAPSASALSLWGQIKAK